ncbi:MAG: PD-(D/E)XK nuclease family protein [Alloprevotella sp.]|nr:PD-(D/E)XK nuclease family protein [Alloprevotella sp.]MBR1653147.1 PD-(D/E)XK nuclease family protein [Alloprevotella sp.]
MKPFLQLVAEDLRHKVGEDFTNVTVVFPNRRAALFFNEYLLAGKPLWAPRYQTIAELFTSLSDHLTVADPIETVCRMYNIYLDATQTDETLDHFYGWGERLLADFDDVDKNMADAKSLFTNVEDYHRLTNLLGSPLTEQQKDALRRFLVDFREDTQGGIRERFCAFWDHIGHIYRTLNEALRKDGLAYEGSLYRNVAEGLKNGTLRFDDKRTRYVFVGFNVLDRVEHTLFSFLKGEGRAMFYWDYDTAYVEDAPQHEAGRFLRQNLKDFGNELPRECFSNFYHDKTVEFVSAPTENAQVFAASEWLSERLRKGDDPRRTALVLCNEELIEPVLHALPEEASHVNITKGFPLAHTPAASLLETCLKEMSARDGKAQGDGKAQDNLETLRIIAERLHEAALSAQEEFSAKEGEPADADKELLRLLYTEAYYQASTIVERFIGLTQRGLLKIEGVTLGRLLRQVVRSASIPFHGDPAQGLQVLGVLETRNLDFDNVLLLSTNEDMLPRRIGDNSFIPYPLRIAYGLTDAEKHTAVFAYYFYRLLQRASHIRLCYNETSTGARTAEMSRFMRQLLTDKTLGPKIRHLPLSVRQIRQETLPLEARKPDDLPSLLNPLSPTSINNFLDCPMRFYYQRIARLHVPEPDADEIENTSFGELFHRTAELFYHEMRDEKGFVNSKELHAVLQNPHRWEHVRELIGQAFRDLEKSRSEVAAVTLEECMRNLIRHDAKLKDLRIIGLEENYSLDIPVEIMGKSTSLKVGGIIDRLDAVTDSATGRRIVRVVDYKTGVHVETCKAMEDIFTPSDTRPHYFLQTFLYTLAVKKRLGQLEPGADGVTAALFYPLCASADDYDCRVEYEQAPLEVFTDEMGQEFTKHLTETLQELLRPDTGFVAAPRERRCLWCDFRSLCGWREEKSR